MELTWITVLKYLGLVLTAGTAFVGSWFLEYTTTDKDTGRKKFTVWGRRAIFFATLAITTSILASVCSDLDAAENRKQAAEQAKIDREELKADREKAAGDLHKLLVWTESMKINPQGRETLKHVLDSFEGTDDYKKHSPDLYDELAKAKSFAELSEQIDTRLERDANGRISDEKKCAIVPRMVKNSGAGYPAESFLINGAASLSYMIEAKQVTVAFTDAADLDSLGGDGYAFVFTDGTESTWLKCADGKSGMSCRDHTGEPDMRAVFNELRYKQIAEIRTGRKRYEIADATGKKLLTTFSCISP